MSGPTIAAAPEEAARQVWVDAHAAPGGTGAADQPLRELSAALALPGRGAIVIHLATGVYQGPVVLPEGASLISGGGVVVITAPGPGAVITARSGRLEGLSVQGGDEGLLLSGHLVAVGVRFSGQRRAAARVESAGRLEAERLEVVGVLPDVDGIVAAPGAAVQLKGAKLSGSIRRAIDATDAEVSLESVATVGAKEQLHQEGGRASAKDCSAAGGSGPAYFVARGHLALERLEVQGHEYGVLAGNAARVEARGLFVRAPQYAAVGAAKSRLTLAGARLEGGTFAAVQLLDGEASFLDVQVEGARGTGILVRLGKASFERLSIRDVVSEPERDGVGGGDGLHVRGAQVVVRDAMVQRAGGAALFASAAARVRVTGLGSEACGQGAIVVEQGASVEADGVVVKNPKGPALAVPDAASLQVKDLLLSGADVPVWAECAAGARVVLTGVRGALPWTPPPCVTVRPK